MPCSAGAAPTSSGRSRSHCNASCASPASSPAKCTAPCALGSHCSRALVSWKLPLRAWLMAASARSARQSRWALSSCTGGHDSSPARLTSRSSSAPWNCPGRTHRGRFDVQRTVDLQRAAGDASGADPAGVDAEGIAGARPQQTRQHHRIGLVELNVRIDASGILGCARAHHAAHGHPHAVAADLEVMGLRVPACPVRRDQQSRGHGESVEPDRLRARTGDLRGIGAELDDQPAVVAADPGAESAQWPGRARPLPASATRAVPAYAGACRRRAADPRRSRARATCRPGRAARAAGPGHASGRCPRPVPTAMRAPPPAPPRPPASPAN